jgi:hypothetical protein
MDTVEILEKARELISDESRWTQEYYAIAADGGLVYPTSPRACRFCAVGAVAYVLGIGDGEEAEKSEPVSYLDEVAAEYGNIIGLNDEAGHQAVIAAFDKAISAARKD